MKLRTLAYAAAVPAAAAFVLGAVGPAAAAVTPQTPPPPWVQYQTFGWPDACNSAGYYYEQEGKITDYFCDEVQPPSWDAAGLTILYVTF
jgi:hypothetical protein